MKILIVTGSLPPMKCGVGDYCLHLLTALANSPNLHVAGMTDASANSELPNSSLEVFPVISGKKGDLSRAISVFRRWNPDIVHFQYPTMGYKRWGKLPALLPVIAWAMKKAVVMTWHEPFHFGKFGWPIAFMVRGVVVVRPNYLDLVRPWVRFLLKYKHFRWIPNSSTIGKSRLNVEEQRAIREELNAPPQSSLVVFFGFVFEHKAVHQLFDIADPARDYIVLLCDLDPEDHYHRRILELAGSIRWKGRVKITGFLPAEKVADVLATADAVVLPFEKGGGAWNTSVHAVMHQSTFLLTTSLDKSGYCDREHVYYARPGAVLDMRKALDTYIGKKVVRSDAPDPWESISQKHIALYESCVKR